MWRSEFIGRRHAGNLRKVQKSGIISHSQSSQKSQLVNLHPFANRTPVLRNMNRRRLSPPIQAADDCDKESASMLQRENPDHFIVRVDRVHRAGTDADARDPAAGNGRGGGKPEPASRSLSGKFQSPAWRELAVCVWRDSS
jgi:hypothetical protein